MKSKRIATSFKKQQVGSHLRQEGSDCSLLSTELLCSGPAVSQVTCGRAAAIDSQPMGHFRSVLKVYLTWRRGTAVAGDDLERHTSSSVPLHQGEAELGLNVIDDRRIWL